MIIENSNLRVLEIINQEDFFNRYLKFKFKLLLYILYNIYILYYIVYGE